MKKIFKNKKILVISIIIHNKWIKRISKIINKLKIVLKLYPKLMNKIIKANIINIIQI